MYKNYQNYTIIKNNKKTLFENVKYYTQIEWENNSNKHKSRNVLQEF